MATLEPMAGHDSAVVHAQHWVCQTAADAIISAVGDGATSILVHPDGDVKCNIVRTAAAL